jgi:hypothetical protein
MLALRASIPLQINKGMKLPASIVSSKIGEYMDPDKPRKSAVRHTWRSP